ncbi:MAG: radical SAM protein [Lachnospiraceae bacterium]|nr:radical SAM protein [Lachnospiraceae bacterium]
MKVLLIKPETVGIFALTAQVDHEPLEMEYLYTVIKFLGHEAVIYDRRHDLTSLKKKLRKVKPDVVCMTGYITQEPLIKNLTKAVKRYDSKIRVVLGGSHVEINYRNFYDSDADYLYHLSGLKNFALLMLYLSGEKKDLPLEDIKGICYRKDGEWIFNDKEVESPADLPVPDRSYLYANLKRYGYLKFRPLALVKNSYSCPNACTFCYCTNRNGGAYRCRNVEHLVEEIASLDVPNVHITDDNFLVSREYLQEFIRLIKEKNIQKKFLIYGRADFIAENEDIMKELAEIGLSLVMVGLEATDDKELDSYNKHATVWHNEECVRILSENNIICAGLFIVHQDMDKKDFKDLYKWIASRPIIPTVSVFTPMQGAANYKEYEKNLVSKDIRKQDLFHCILKPKHMSVFAFTMQYYKMSLKLAFHNRKAELYKTIGIKDFLFVIKTLCIQFRRIFIL